MKITIVVREIGKITPDYSLDFELPEVPSVGSYISIQRPDKCKPFGEDLVVRKIWWRLEHPDTGSIHATPANLGTIQEIFVECDPVTGPYSSDAWLNILNGAKNRGIDIEEMEIERFSVRERDFKL